MINRFWRARALGSGALVLVALWSLQVPPTVSGRQAQGVVEQTQPARVNQGMPVITPPTQSMAQLPGTPVEPPWHTLPRQPSWVF
jgi:hypothetical protein